METSSMTDAESSCAAASDIASVADAIERLRAAMLAGDGATLKTLVADDLTYGHSSGLLEDRKAFLTNLDGTSSFESLVLSNQTITIVGDNAIVRHIFDSENNLPDGRTSRAHVGVLQVWNKQATGWRLLARQAFSLSK
jgi:ketosteroid isomerase-like protein